MEHIIGGYTENPKLIVDKALNFFEKTYSKNCDFNGTIEQNYFLGIIKEKSNKQNGNIFLIDDDKIFKSLYYNEVPEILKSRKESLNYDNEINTLINDFIFVKYERNKGINIYVDKFAREKIYYTITPPYFFSTSLKFLISIIKNKKINYNALTRFLIMSVNVGYETIFSKINRLDVGKFLHLSNNNIQINEYWKINKEFFQIPDHDSKDINYWKEFIYQSLKDALNIPVKTPVLSLMSGGLDSTLITSILLKELEVPIEALTIVVPNYNDEEGYKAREIAEFLNIPHKISKTRLESMDELENFYSETFNLTEEPMGTSYFSRYFAFKEVEKSNKKNVLMGDGAGEILSLVRDYLFNNFKYTNYLYYIPLIIRKRIMKFFHEFYYPSLKLISKLKDKNKINSLEILMNSDFLQTNSQFETLFVSWQWTNLEKMANLTNHKVDLKTYLAPIRKNVESYPLKDYNKACYQYLITGINSDSLYAHNLSSFFDLKLYSPYIADISFQKILPIPTYLKTLGDRGKWIVREMAKEKKLLPKSYFDWKPKYGLRQIYYTEESFEIVKTYALGLINRLKKCTFMNFKHFEIYFKKSDLKTLTTHSSEYMKFNAWLGFLGWLASIEL